MKTTCIKITPKKTTLNHLWSISSQYFSIYVVVISSINLFGRLLLGTQFGSIAAPGIGLSKAGRAA